MNVSHEPPGCAASGGGPPPFYKAEHPPQEHQPDPMYYQVCENFCFLNPVLSQWMII